MPTNLLEIHFGWTVVHEGVRLYPDGINSGYRPIDDIRAQAVAAQNKHAENRHIIEVASNNELLSIFPLVTGRAYSELMLPMHFQWVAGHEGERGNFLTLSSKGDFASIRGIYHTKQDHNRDARNLLAAVSDRHIQELVND
ncbi:MAG: hypothetical protein ABI459_07460, partial [Deltaproteobacteria bacterium]